MSDVIEITLLLAILAVLAAREVKLPRKTRRGGIILDSCSLIDGRIVGISQAGFVTGELIVPQFILRELQTLADGRDAHKRERARFGLDTVAQLQVIDDMHVIVDDNTLQHVDSIDDKLISLAKLRKARLCTTDFNLNKVAVAEGVRVLNVNELAQELRPLLLPGEVIQVKILQKGSGRGQGVGYLDDGTMVVVESAAKLLGRPTEVKITQMHQTAAGKMAFAIIPKK